MHAQQAPRPHEKRGAFGGFIGPRTLVGQVRCAAPWLFDGSQPATDSVPATQGARLIDHGFHPLGWWSILREAERLQADDTPTPAAVTDYFALCLAAHCASVATFVPTDVDTKIRHALWFSGQPDHELCRMRDLALYHRAWRIQGFTPRLVEVEGVGAVSGYDGERLSVLCGALLGMLAAGRQADADELATAVDAELQREARAFALLRDTPGRELDLLALCAYLTHNAGDIMQALEHKGARRLAAQAHERFGDLTRERFDRYGGAFGAAALVYRELLAPEGHRHYPLREQRLLRASHELLLPFSPFLDAWGARLATWPAWSPAERALVLGSLVEGCRKVPGQEGYFRALCGFNEAHRGGLWARDLDEHLGSAVRKHLKDSLLRRKVAVRRDSFESSYIKRARALLATAPRSRTRVPVAPVP